MARDQPAAVISPLAWQIDKLSEAAKLLEATRPELAAVCRETACTLREETELALWPSPPTGTPAAN